MSSNRIIAAIAALLTAAITSCGSGDLTLDQADPDAVPADPAYETVFAIIHRECVPCHTDSEGETDESPEADLTRSLRGGAEPDLRTCRDIVSNLGAIAEEALEKNTMPPGAWPRLTSEEKLTIQRWIDNGADAPCN